MSLSLAGVSMAVVSLQKDLSISCFNQRLFSTSCPYLEASEIQKRGMINCNSFNECILSNMETLTVSQPLRRDDVQARKRKNKKQAFIIVEFNTLNDRQTLEFLRVFFIVWSCFIAY